MSQKVCYLAAIHESRDSGVVKKIESTVKALIDKGYTGETYLGTEDGYRGVLQIRKRLHEVDTDLVILRSCGYYVPLLITALLVMRMGGTKIVIDTPTPVVNLLFEIWGQRKSICGALIRSLLLLLSLPWSHWIAHRIIQYGREHPWFLLGLRKKTVLMGNGVRVADYPSPTNPLGCPEDSLVLIGVAKLFFWHGFDRIIRGIATYEKDRMECANPSLPVRFVIVGDGPERAVLEQLVNDMSITHQVCFKGYQTGKALRELYSTAHIAVSSLGLHRQNLTLASPLKAREYLSMGLPIIFSHEDPDVPDTAEFVFKPPSDDSPLIIADIVSWYTRWREKGGLPMQPRRFAEQHLDFSVKTEIYESLLQQKSA